MCVCTYQVHIYPGMYLHNPGFVRIKQTKRQHVWYVSYMWYLCTCILYSTVRIYYDTSTLHQCCCKHSGYTSRDSVYYCCACARTRCNIYIVYTSKYFVYIIVHTLQQQTATAAVVAVLQLLDLSAAACLTLYTAVYIVVVLLLLGLNCIQ